MILTAFCANMIVLLLIGFLSSRHTHSSTDFFIASKSLGAISTAISSVASSESGWVILGAVGMAYAQGVSAVWFVPGCLLGYTVNWYLIAPKMRAISHASDALTLTDFIVHFFAERDTTDRYGNQIRLLCAIIIFLCMMGYVAAQLTSAGKAFNAVFEFSYTQSVIVGCVLIVAYTLMGGFRAVVWTDILQGGLMAMALILLPVITITHVGGITVLLQSLYTIDPNLISPFQGSSGSAAIGMVIGLFGIGLGYPGQPHVLVRYMAAKDFQAIRQGTVIAISWGVLVYYGAILLGLCSRILLPDIADPEYAFPELTMMLLSPLLTGILLSAIMSAIMSTADSQLLVAASAIANDIYGKVIPATSNRVLRVSRLVVLLLGALSLIFALTKVRVIFWFVLFAWSGLGASFGPVIILMLYWKGITPQGAIAGLVTGFVTTVIWKLSGLSSILYELVPAFAFSLTAIWSVSMITHRSPIQKSNE